MTDDDDDDAVSALPVGSFQSHPDHLHPQGHEHPGAGHGQG